MQPPDLLEKPAYLLREVQRKAQALPVRLRVLNMLTYALDVLCIEQVPILLQESKRSGEALAQLRALEAHASQMLNEATRSLRGAILPELEARGVALRQVEECSPAQLEWLSRHFAARVRPLLTPLAVDAGRPFPQISAHSLNLLAVVETPTHFDIDLPSYARLKIPRRVPRLTEVALDGAPARTFVLSEDMVRASIGALFPGMRVAGVFQFRILRGALQPLDQAVGRHTALARQKAWPVVRIDVEAEMPAWVLRWLQENLEAPDAMVFRREQPLGIGTLAAELADRIMA